VGSLEFRQSPCLYFLEIHCPKKFEQQLLIRVLFHIDCQLLSRIHKKDSNIFYGLPNEGAVGWQDSNFIFFFCPLFLDEIPRHGTPLLDFIDVERQGVEFGIETVGEEVRVQLVDG
jgi:hypothetical protein